MSEYKTSAIILAAGQGSRMNSDKTKQFITICGKTVLERTVLAFGKSRAVNEIIVVTRKDELDSVKDMILNLKIKKDLRFTVGGNCRAESARNGFLAISEGADFVAIHDGARCLITPEMIDKVVEAAYKSSASTAVCAVSDTVKSVDSNCKILSTLPREEIYLAQTPQVFSRDVYSAALSSCEDLSVITDDNMLVEAIGKDIYAVDLGPENIKITTLYDITVAKAILTERGEDEAMNIRTGHGYDVHRLVEGRKLIIGGVEIPHEKGLLGHSDADVLVHAIMDSLLGAASLGDIGRHFPDTDEQYRGVSSIHLLTKVASMLNSLGYKISNVDATLILQRPKISSYIPKMVSNIAFALGISKDRVNVKATTEEKLGFTGREEGAAAHSVALIYHE